MADNGTSQPLSPGGRVNLAQTFTPPAEIRHDTLLVEGWRFIKSDVTGAEQESFDDQSWAVISIPHTWNAQDGQDGGNDYFRGTGFYRRHFSIDASEAGPLPWRATAKNFKASGLGRSPASNACTTWTLRHGCCYMGKVGFSPDVITKGYVR